MGTTDGLAKAFNQAGEMFSSGKKNDSAAAQERARDIELAENEIEIERLSLKRDRFAEDKGNLLREKLASNNARMAAAGLVGTSASLDAFSKYFASKSESELMANEFFADLDLQKLELALLKKSQLSLSGGGKKSLL